MKLIYSKSIDPTLNLAIEEILARNAEEETFMLWRNGPSIIVGRHQNTAAEIDGEYVTAHNIPVVRRITGGGAVYHDLGNVNFSCISLEREWGPNSAAVFVAPIVSGLKALGIDAQFSGRNDILANGCKVSGCARSVPLQHTLFHGTLLFDVDLDVLANALRPDPDKIISKGIKSVRARVGNLKAMLPLALSDMSPEEFLESMKKSVQEFFCANVFQPVSESVIEQAMLLADAKYRTWNWNFGTAIEYQVKKRIKFAGGIITAEYNVKGNKVADLHFSGDFFGERPIDGVVDKLNGCQPVSVEVAKRLDELNLNEYVSGLKKEELIQLMTPEA